MRTTIQLDDQVLKEFKAIASATGRTLGSVIEEALREKLARRRSAEAEDPIELPVFKGDGLQPGVDLDDSSSLLDLMEEQQ